MIKRSHRSVRNKKNTPSAIFQKSQYVSDLAKANNLQKCVDRMITDELATIPPGRGGVLFRHDFAPKDLRLAEVASKRWPNGSVLNCAFLDGTSLQRRRPWLDGVFLAIYNNFQGK